MVKNRHSEWGQLHNSLQAASTVVVLLAGHRLSTFFRQPQSYDSTRKWLGRDVEGWLWSMPSLSGLQNIFRRCLSKRILAQHPLWFGVPQAVAALCCPSAADLAVLSSMNRGWEWVDTIVFYMTGWLTSWALVLVVVSWDKLSIFDCFLWAAVAKPANRRRKPNKNLAQWPLMMPEASAACHITLRDMCVWTWVYQVQSILLWI